MSELIKKIEHALNVDDYIVTVDVLNDCLEVAILDEWVSVDDGWPEKVEGSKILGIDMDDSEPYVFECMCDDGVLTNVGGETFTHWKPSHHPKK